VPSRPNRSTLICVCVCVCVDVHAGNEGTGLRTNVKRACTGYIAVEMGAPRSQLAADSLNVSVAAGILVHTLVSAAEAGAAQRQPSATATAEGAKA